MTRSGVLGLLLVALLALTSCTPSSGALRPEPTLLEQPEAEAQVGQAASAPASAVEAESTLAEQTLATSALAEPTLTPAVPSTGITLNEPEPGAAITSPVHVRGQVSRTPFESTLRGRVYDAAGQVLGETPIMVDAEMGSPGAFDAFIPFSAVEGGGGTIEIADLSAKDGSVLESSSVAVAIETGAPMGAVDIPASGESVVLPLRILARVGQPGQAVRATLAWSDGTELAQTFSTLKGEDGQGLLMASLNWPGESQPPEPPSQPASLELRDEAGGLLAQQEVEVLSPADPATQAIALYFLLGEDLQPVALRIPQTEAIGTAALQELLWGPPAPNLAGFSTALPTPEEVLSYAGREPGWGPRVTLKSLVIADGVAIADFSKEMQAYGGGSLRVSLLRRQIEMTLMQFPTVRQVIIAVEGEAEGVLQP